MNIQSHNEESQKNQKVHKPYSKFREIDDNNFKFKISLDGRKLAPYGIVILIFFLSLYFFFLLFDGIIMPALVHSKDMTKVPDITGKPINDAARILANHNLKYKVNQQVFSEEYQSQHIVKQVPFPGKSVKQGRTIYLTLSKGREMVSVPQLIGFPLSKARVELMKFGLEMGEINFENSEYIPKDTIMSQSMPGGKLVPYGSVVDVVVSLGSNQQIEMPNLVGLRYDEIFEVINQLGLVVGNVTYKDSETFTPNTVIYQTPIGGGLTSKSTPIDLIISK